MRYIIAIDPSTGERRPYIGLAPVTHRNLVAQAHEEGFTRVTSAAFCHMGPALGVTVHHRSESLNIGPGPDDAMLIHMHYRQTLDLIPEFQLKPSVAPAPDSRLST